MNTQNQIVDAAHEALQKTKFSSVMLNGTDSEKFLLGFYQGVKYWCKINEQELNKMVQIINHEKENT